MSPWTAALFALFIWWFSTGLILWRVRVADNGGPDQHFWSVVLGLPLVIAGLYGTAVTADDGTAFGTYAAFLSALAIWGWIELAFLSGIITGPVVTPCPPSATEWDRFTRAIGTIAFHELVLIAALAAIWKLTQGADNLFALWTFAILFLARISAKMNLFLGVPRINVEFLPRPLAHLASYFRFAPMNAVFPLSITLLTFATACMAERLISAETVGQTVGFALLAALTALALLEHWFFVLPLPDQKLWRWMLPAPKPAQTVIGAKVPGHGLPLHTLNEDVHGL